MSKGLKSLWKTGRGKNRGFTIIELIVAIAILGILSVTVIYMMTSSSKSYSSMSVESQLQSEAQLVANSITELAIDSFDAKDVLPGDTGSLSANSVKGECLLLDTKVDGETRQYMVVQEPDEDALYLAKRVYNDGTSSWGGIEKELLANYISGFTVDTSRVEDENMLEFSLAYEKNGRNYVGKYQVLMRNRAYADKEKEEDPTEPNERLRIDISPQIVYVNIIDNKLDSYHVSDVNSAKVSIGSGVPFTATVDSNIGASDKVKWELKNADTDIFTLDSEEAATNLLNGTATAKKSFRDVAMDSFMVLITKTENLAGGKKIDASPKAAQVLLRRIKGINLYALSGTVKWADRYEQVFGGVSDPEADGYAYAGVKGKYMPIHLNAAITSSNIAYGGGVSWKIYEKTTSGTWTECSNTAYAQLQNAVTPTSTSNVVTFGSAVENGQVYKVVATSLFDPSFEAEYIFGIAPNGPKSDDGFYSRGYYTDMGALLESWVWHKDQALVEKLVFLKVTSVDGSENVGLSEDKISIRQDADGTWRLYVDYDAFAYAGSQKEDLYVGKVDIHLTVGYYDKYGHLCIDGEERGTYLDELEAQEGRKVCNGTDHHPGCQGGDACKCNCTKVLSTAYPVGRNEDGKIFYGSSDVTYTPKPVVVSKVDPTDSVVVVEKGKARGITVKTNYYNILSPRKGTYYLGAYIDDMYNNLLESGKGSTHAYFNVEMASSYGDTDSYIDTAVVQLGAKTTKEQKMYLTEPLKLRLTANDFYLIKKGSPNENSYTDYSILIANVEGTPFYIPGPEATGAYAWSADEVAKLDAGNETSITGKSATGSTVQVVVTKKDGIYSFDYNGKTYIYKQNYNVWAK
nr:type II secretion system protein [Lachnospiraceae bacterium]